MVMCWKGEYVEVVHNKRQDVLRGGKCRKKGFFTRYIGNRTVQKCCNQVNKKDISEVRGYTKSKLLGKQKVSKLCVG